MYKAGTTHSKGIFIIAEAGVNHNGSVDIALKLVDEASKCGADAVKFQSFVAGKVISRFAPKAAYQKTTTDPGESQLAMARKLELGPDSHKVLFEHCRKREIMFLSSPFDLDSIDLLRDIGLGIFKIPSGEITNLPYMRMVGRLRKKVILSSGMADLDEIGSALGVLIGEGTEKDDITVLHCNTEYPTPYEDVNLRAMLTIQETFDVDVGYSDHSPGIEVAIGAAALGARVIEKHFTLDSRMPGPDHKASLEPHEFSRMVLGIRHIEMALGTGIKKPSPSEIKNIAIARKSIVAAKPIQKGETLTEDNVTVKRPGHGVSPMRWDEVIGSVATRSYEEDEPIEA